MTTHTFLLAHGVAAASGEPCTEDAAKAKTELLSELAVLRRRVARLEAFLGGHEAQPPPAATANTDAPPPEQSFLHKALNSIAFPVYIIDAHTCEIVLANRATHDDRMPAVTTCYALTHHRRTPCDGADGPCPIEEVKRTGKPVIVEHAHYADAGPARRFEIHAFPIFDGRGCITHVIEHNVDVTHRRRTEEELANHKKSLEMLVATLERSNQELKGFASLAAHDIRSPMAMVTLAVASLQELTASTLDDTGKKVLGILMRGVKRMAEMTASLYRCSQVDYQGIAFTTVDLNQVVDEVVSIQLFTEIQQSRGTITVAEPLGAILGDEVQILQLMQNLIANALKYHREGIEPAVTLRTRDAEHDRIRVEVEDNGIGIREADREKVFAMFNRLDDAREHDGLGVGLAFCKKVAERHGGRIGVTSTYGSGSTFWVELPRAHQRDMDLDGDAR